MNQETTTHASEYAILYVDDEELALKYFRRTLGRGFTVHVATNAQAGLEILAAQGDAIGVLVSDQRMPGESGVELLKKVRKRWPHIVRVLTTAYADLDDAIEAVNRGEIFRYITKPWDVNTLRTEIGQAMELFRLRHEHAELMREKMSVWQRLLQLGRLRDLIVMSGSFTHLRHSQNAVAQYLADHLSPPEINNRVSPRHLDLWQLTEAEINQTLTFVSDVISRTVTTTSRDEPFETVLDSRRLQLLVADAFNRVDCPEGDSLPVIRVAREPAMVMLKELASITGGSTAGVTLRPTPNGAAVSLSAHLAMTPADDGLTASGAAGLLTAYLLAFHHGGYLERRVVADGPHQYVMTLPADPGETTLTPPQPGWLDSLLVRLEGWD